MRQSEFNNHLRFATRDIGETVNTLKVLATKRCLSTRQKATVRKLILQAASEIKTVSHYTTRKEDKIRALNNIFGLVDEEIP